MVIDRAVVSTHTSLTTIIALLAIHRYPSHSRSTAVFDLGLQHARAVFEALGRHVTLALPCAE